MRIGQTAARIASRTTTRKMVKLIFLDVGFWVASTVIGKKVLLCACDPPYWSRPEAVSASTKARAKTENSTLPPIAGPGAFFCPRCAEVLPRGFHQSAY